jgi:hypothetical protein
MDFHPDKLAKTVRIPVKVVDGKLAYFYDRPVPLLKPGAIGEVVLPAYAVLNRDALQLLQAEQEILLFDAGTTLFLGMKMQRVPMPIRSTLIEPPVLSQAQGMLLMSVCLTEPLCLVLRGTKQAILRGGECQVPFLETPANSLNHAYTLASMKYEPDRISHTGNIFTRCFFCEDEQFLPLEVLRGRHEVRYEWETLLTPETKAEAQKRRGQTTPSSE